MTGIATAKLSGHVHLVPVGRERANLHVQDIDGQRGEMRAALVFLDRVPGQTKNVEDTGQRRLFVAMTKSQRLGRDARADLGVKLPRGRLVGGRRLPFLVSEGL